MLCSVSLLLLNQKLQPVLHEAEGPYEANNTETKEASG